MDLIPITKGCVSFSLYGSGAKYAWGMLENVALVRKYYPGWTCRVYLEMGHYAKPALLRAGAEVLDMEPLPGSGGMFWRFAAANDKSFTHVIIRDADSRVNPRDAACTEDWLRSGKSLHSIRDHPWHLTMPLIGGAWGIRTERFNMRKAIDTWNHTHQYGDDEKFLGSVVWPAFASMGDTYVNSFQPEPGHHPIPAHAPYNGFVCEQMPLSLHLEGRWRAYVLSPEKYTVRRERFFNKLADYGGFLNNNVEWYKATEVADCDIPPNYPHVNSYPHYFAATKDHKDMLRQGMEDALDYLFVFEDDAAMRYDFDEHLARTLLCVPEDWWAIQLGGQAPTDGRRSWYSEYGTTKYPDALARVGGCSGMHGVLWSREGMSQASPYFDNQPLCTIDYAFAGWQRQARNFYSPARWVVEIDPQANQFGRDT